MEIKPSSSTPKPSSSGNTGGGNTGGSGSPTPSGNKETYEDGVVIV